MEDSPASKSDTTSDTVASVAASNEPTNHSPPAAEDAHQMSTGSDSTSELDQAPNGAATDGEPLKDRTGQLTRTSMPSERLDEDGGAKRENDLNWMSDRKGAHEDSRSSSLTSDSQKVNHIAESSRSYLQVTPFLFLRPNRMKITQNHQMQAFL